MLLRVLNPLSVVSFLRSRNSRKKFRKLLRQYQWDSINICLCSSCLNTYLSQSVFLVGGFAANTWLFKRIKAELEAHNIALYRPDSHMYVLCLLLYRILILIGFLVRNKAVADGAVSSFLEHAVTIRVAKRTYGVTQNIPYNRDDPEHVARLALSFSDVSGTVVLPNSFSVLLAKVYLLLGSLLSCFILSPIGHTGCGFENVYQNISPRPQNHSRVQERTL